MEGNVREKNKVPYFPLLSCKLSISVKEKPDRNYSLLFKTNCLQVTTFSAYENTKTTKSR